MSGDATFDDLLRANAAYVGEFGLAGVAAGAARGLAILTCIDSRIEPLGMFGLQPGDAMIIRNAGGRVTDEVLADLVVATHLLRVERVMLLQHTDCRMAAPDEAAIHDAVQQAGAPDTSAFAFRVVPDREAALRADVELVEATPALADVRVGGFVYDVASGGVTRVA